MEFLVRPAKVNVGKIDKTKTHPNTRLVFQKLKIGHNVTNIDNYSGTNVNHYFPSINKTEIYSLLK